MYGEITKFREDLGVGVIDAEDGRKYRFAACEIVSRIHDLVGKHVDFLVDARRPHQIVLLSGSPWTALGDIRDCIANDR
jgi:hypothetical protein